VAAEVADRDRIIAEEPEPTGFRAARRGTATSGTATSSVRY